MLMYLSISQSSIVMAPFEFLICLILCSSLSIRACRSYEVREGITIGGGAILVWLCKVNGIVYGVD